MNEKWSPLSQTQLREALGEADLRVLLMVLFHLTADRKWLSDPFLPKRDVNLIADTEAGLPVKVGVEIRKKAAELLSANQLDVAIDDPGNEMMTKLMSLCLGEAVPPEYAPMMREEMGFVSRQVDWSDGEWFAEIDEAGVPKGVKAGEWKAAYHHGRAVMQSLVMLEAMLHVE